MAGKGYNPNREKDGKFAPDTSGKTPPVATPVPAVAVETAPAPVDTVSKAYQAFKAPAHAWDSYETQVAAYEAMGMPTSDAQAAVEGAYAQAAAEEAASRKAAQEAIDSFERSDTDGFMSQWASGVMSSVHRLESDIKKNGGTWTFPVLMKDGELVPCFQIQTYNQWKYQNETKWAVFASEEDANSGHGHIIEWIGLSDRAVARKGYTVGTQVRVARADTAGTHAVNVHAIVLPADGMKFNPDAPIVPDVND